MADFYRRRGKRALDLLVASTALVVTSPVLFAAAISVRRTMGRPVLFRQVRPGLGDRPFTLLKIRTMQLEFDAQGVDLPDADRLTPLGRFLRASSIDELPELVNVIRGDMSLVGPRPLLMEYLPLYSPDEARRHEVRPGITGWAQVSGRNALSWEEKLSRDVWYVDHVSFALDARILWRTIGAVVRREGISAAGHETAPRFGGGRDTARGDLSTSTSA